MPITWRHFLSGRLTGSCRFVWCPCQSYERFSESMAALLVQSDRNRQLFQSGWTLQENIVLKFLLFPVLSLFWPDMVRYVDYRRCRLQIVWWLLRIKCTSSEVVLEIHTLLTEEIQFLPREDNFTTSKIGQCRVSTVWGHTTWDTSAHSTIKVAMHTT